MNRKEVGKRKGGFTCIDALVNRKREDGYRYRRRVGGMRELEKSRQIAAHILRGDKLIHAADHENMANER